MTTLTSPYAPPIQPSRWKLIRGYLRRNKSLLVGLLILVFLILFTVTGLFIVDPKHAFPLSVRSKQPPGILDFGIENWPGKLPLGSDFFGRDIAFIGNLTSLQNLDAATYLAEEILPLVRQRFPKVILRIIGRIHRSDALSLSKYNGVVVTGEVLSIADSINGCGVGACPLRLGAGIHNKVLEYMALGLPTVTTSLGLEGINAKDKKELLVADSLKEYSSAIIQLLEDRELAASLAKSGRAFVEQQHSWDAVLEPLVTNIITHMKCRP
jgi:hypothetical protein